MFSAPKQLKNIAALIDVAVQDLLAQERNTWSAVNPALDVPLAELNDFVMRGGKRIRPAYCHWGWVTANGNPDLNAPEPLAGGCALELLHAFALIHDDVMDGSPTRRSAPAVWASYIERHQHASWRGEPRRFGEAAAVLIGDIALVIADRTLGDVPAVARRVWDALRTELNMGQYLDVIGTAQGAVAVEDARAITRYKTALYTIVRPLQLGAALAGNADLAAALAAHGLPLGMAFQLRDDLLGAFGDPQQTGKPVGEDLREGKPTVLLALAREEASQSQKGVLAKAGTDVTESEVAAMQQVLVETGAVTATETEINRYLASALTALDSLPNIHGNREALSALAHYVVDRET